MNPLDHPRSAGRIGGRVVSLVLGLVLVTAGTLKARQWTADPYAPGELPAVPALRAAVVVAELALGLWLLLGAYPRSARAVAIGCFALFLAVATRDALENKASCGCFGSLTVPPWVTAAFDLAALGCLIGFVPPPRPTSRRLAALVAVLIVGASIPVATTIVRAGRRPHLIPTPAVVGLGDLRSGAVARSGFTISNTGTAAVEVASVATSCSCVEVRLPAGAIAPGQTVSGDIVLDTGVKPDFTGGLSVKVTGSDPAGRTVFTLSVEAVVRAADR